MREFAISVSIGLLTLTGLLAAGLAAIIWEHDPQDIGWPIGGFATSAACLAGCILIRETLLAIVLMAVQVGILLLVLFGLALSGAAADARNPVVTIEVRVWQDVNDGDRPGWAQRRVANPWQRT